MKKFMFLSVFLSVCIGIIPITVSSQITGDDIPVVTNSLSGTITGCVVEYGILIEGCFDSTRTIVKKMTGTNVYAEEGGGACDTTYMKDINIGVHGPGMYKFTSIIYGTYGVVKNKLFYYYIGGELCNRVGDTVLEEYKVYPNPTTGIVVSDFEYSFVVIDNISGYTVKMYQQNETIDLSSMCSGMYVLRFFDENHNFVYKEVVMKI